MTSPHRPRVLLGVSASIAVYKAVDVARRLQERDVEVQVVMTPKAQRFVPPLTFRAITRRPVLVDVFADSDQIEHVERATAADLLLVAPASADVLARMSHGMADDLLTAIALGTPAPIVVAPAMESRMWLHPATVANVNRLRARGVEVVGPTTGELASGRTGIGRMAEPDDIVAHTMRRLAPGDLAGLKVVVTAGPTWEAIDPVRILSNRSTGAMGIAIADAAARRGAHTHLVLGPTHLQAGHAAVQVRRVETAEQMLGAAQSVATDTDVFIAAAAVTDFRPAVSEPHKLKRGDLRAHAVALCENPDVLMTMAGALRLQARGATIVGFAAETEHLEENAREKLGRKGCDLIIANRVGPQLGFGSQDTSLLAVGSGGPAGSFGPGSKSAAAHFVLDQVLRLRKQSENA